MSDHNPRMQSILVVDDNEDDYEAVARAFKKVGLTHSVSLCTTGQEALDFLTQPKDPDKERALPVLIMLDLNMPGMDGFQLLQRIRGDAAIRQIPVVIWTTSSNEKDIDACYQLGANAFMQKPVIFDNLVESIKRLKQYWFETALLPS